MTTGEQRVVVVTGSSRGLGRAIAIRFGADGWRVAVNCLHDTASAEAVVPAVEKAGGSAILVRADIRTASGAGSLVTAAQDRWGRLDVLVNNAGIARDGLCVRMPEDAWDEVLATNVDGPFRCMRAAAAVMTGQGDGHIINIVSITGMQGRAGQANYAASKAALIGLTKAAAKEWGSSNIRVNAVLPGYLRTDLGGTVDEEMHERIMEEHTLPVRPDLDEVALFIVHLAGMRAVSGQVFNLDSRII